MITGWITNKGEIIECRPYEHFETNDTTINKVWGKYQEELDESYLYCMDLAESGEHPEWHIYEIAESNYKDNAYKELYKLGYVRLSKYGNDLAVESHGQHIANHKELLEELSDKYNCLLKYFKI